MRFVKNYYNRRLLNFIQQNPEEANYCSTVDNNKLIHLLTFSLFFKTLKLLIIIFNFGFFIGILWLVFCELNFEMQHMNDYNIPEGSDYQMYLTKIAKDHEIL